MEYFDIYDKDVVKTGKKILRGSKLQPGEYILVTDAAIVNSKGQILVQKRSPDKVYCPNKWGLTGGSVDVGESSCEACAREIEEEIGLKVDMSQAKFLERRLDDINQAFIDTWLIKCDAKIEDLKMQVSEVSEIKWIDKEELEKIIQLGEFMPTLIFVIKYL